MKKLLFILGAMGLCLMGCDSDDNDKNTQKSEQTNQNEQNSGQNAQGEGADKQGEAKFDFTPIYDFIYGVNYDFSTLTEDQQAQLKKAYMDACVSYYDGLPVCKSEEYAYYKCLYIDNTIEYWNAESEKEDKCRTEHEEGPERDACIEPLYQACKELQDKFFNCMDTNKDAYDKYKEQHSNFEDELEKLLQEWGLNIKDYYIDED